MLGDIVGPASDGLCMGDAARARAAAVTGQRVPPSLPADVAIGDGIVVLRRVHRFGGAIAALAERHPRGDAEAALDVLAAGGSNVQWIATRRRRSRPPRSTRRRADGGRRERPGRDRGGAGRRGRVCDRARSVASASCARTAAVPRASRPGRDRSRAGSRAEVEGFSPGATGTSAVR